MKVLIVDDHTLVRRGIGHVVHELRTIEAFGALVRGDLDNIPQQAFRMVGGLDDVMKKARELGVEGA